MLRALLCGMTWYLCMTWAYLLIYLNHFCIIFSLKYKVNAVWVVFSCMFFEGMMTKISTCWLRNENTLPSPIFSVCGQLNLWMQRPEHEASWIALGCPVLFAAPPPPQSPFTLGSCCCCCLPGVFPSPAFGGCRLPSDLLLGRLLVYLHSWLLLHWGSWQILFSISTPESMRCIFFSVSNQLKMLSSRGKEKSMY